jgi:hypothetical protein
VAQKGCFMRGVLIFSRPPEAEDTPLDPPRAQNGLRTVKNVILSENEAAGGPKRLSYARSAHIFNAKCTLEWPPARFSRRKVHLGVASGGLHCIFQASGRLRHTALSKGPLGSRNHPTMYPWSNLRKSNPSRSIRNAPLGVSFEALLD